MSIIYRV